jgi:hypothetical protein
MELYLLILLLNVLMYKRYYVNALLLSNDVESNPGPTYRTCPSCNASVHIRKKVCECGFKFNRRSIPFPTVFNSQIYNIEKRVSMSLRRYKESDDQIAQRQEIDKLQHARKRAFETLEESNERREANKVVQSKRRQ